MEGYRLSAESGEEFRGKSIQEAWKLGIICPVARNAELQCAERLGWGGNGEAAKGAPGLRAFSRLKTSLRGQCDVTEKF